MIPQDVVVFLHPNGKDYVASFETHGWQRWPAAEAGWLSRQRCPATLVDSCEELEPRLADLAIRLSGVTP